MHGGRRESGRGFHVLRILAGPGLEAAVDAVDRVEPLVQQVLRRAAAAVAVVAHHHYRPLEVVLLHKGRQGGVGEVKGARRMPGFKTLRIADVDQGGAALFPAGVRLLNVDRFELFHTADCLVIGGRRYCNQLCGV